MWWSFHTDFTKGEYPKYKGVKVCSVDTSAKDKLLAIRKTQESEVSKKRIEIIKAVGTTPRSHTTLPKLVGRTPHLGNQDVFKAVTEANKDYERTLIERYVVGASLARDLGGVYQHLDHLGTTTSLVRNTSTDTSMHMGSVIQKLEAIIDSEENKQALVSPVTADQPLPHVAPRPLVNITDTSIAINLRVTPSAANSDDFIASETQYEWEQWMTPEERLRYLAKPGRVVDLEELDYILAQKDTDTFSTTPVYDWASHFTLFYNKEGFRLMNWLRRRDSRWRREKTEAIRVQAYQAYTPQLGEDVHPLYHAGEEVFNKLTAIRQRGRIRAIDDSVMIREPFGVWFRRGEYTKLDMQHIPNMITEQINKEALADKLIENYISRKEVVSYGSDFVEEEPMDETATVVRTVPVPVSKVAEIVDLSIVRSKRTDSISNLLASIKPKLEGLTEEQKEGVRSAVIEALNKALG